MLIKIFFKPLALCISAILMFNHIYNWICYCAAESKGYCAVIGKGGSLVVFINILVKVTKKRGKLMLAPHQESWVKLEAGFHPKVYRGA